MGIKWRVSEGYLRRSSGEEEAAHLNQTLLKLALDLVKMTRIPLSSKIVKNNEKPLRYFAASICPIEMLPENFSESSGKPKMSSTARADVKAKPKFHPPAQSASSQSVANMAVPQSVLEFSTAPFGTILIR